MGEARSPENFACLTARKRLIHVDRLRLSFLESGTPGRPALCLLHGSSAHAHWFDLVTPNLNPRFHIIALDQRGHGESDWARPPTYNPRDFADDLLGLMHAVGWRRMTLVGHSMGGHNAMCFAAWHPERVDALVLAECRPLTPIDRQIEWRTSSGRPLHRHRSMDSAVSSFRLFPPGSAADPTLLHHIAREGIAKRDDAWVYRFDPACNATRSAFNAWPLLSKIVSPTLIIRGQLSQLEPRTTAERMHAAIQGAVLVEIPGAHHHIPLDTPLAFAEAVAGFLGEVDLSAASNEGPP